MAFDKEKAAKKRQSQLSAFMKPAEPVDARPEEKKVIPEAEQTADEAPKKKLTKRDTHKVYSFWADKEQIEVWKCYQEASNALEKAEDLGLEAISEYIRNHPLSGTEAELYELKLKAKGLENSKYR